MAIVVYVVMVSIVEVERNQIKERTQEGISIAKAVPEGSKTGNQDHISKKFNYPEARRS